MYITYTEAEGVRYDLELEITRVACVLGSWTQELDHGSLSSRCAIGLHGDDRVLGSHGSHLKVLTLTEGLIIRVSIPRWFFWSQSD